MNKFKIFLIVLSSLFFCVACQTVKDDGTLQSNNMKPIKPNYAEAAKINIQLGVYYLQQGLFDRAKVKLLAAEKEAPNNPYVYSALGYYYEKTSQHKLAEQNYKKAVMLAPNDGYVRNNYGSFLCFTKKYNQAIDEFKKATTDSKYVEASQSYENAGLCALKIPNAKLAENFFKKAISRNPKLPTSQYELSYLAYKNGDNESAKSYLANYMAISVPDQKVVALGVKIAKALNDAKLENYYRHQL